MVPDGTSGYLAWLPVSKTDPGLQDLVLRDDDQLISWRNVKNGIRAGIDRDSEMYSGQDDQEDVACRSQQARTPDTPLLSTELTV